MKTDRRDAEPPGFSGPRSHAGKQPTWILDSRLQPIALSTNDR